MASQHNDDNINETVFANDGDHNNNGTAVMSRVTPGTDKLHPPRPGNTPSIHISRSTS